MEERYGIFLSYANGDKPLAEELYKNIKQAGLHCFMSEKNIEPGKKWSERGAGSGSPAPPNMKYAALPSVQAISDKAIPFP